MSSIKLLALTSRNYLVIFLALTLFFFGIFYFIIEKEVLKSTDEVLFNRKTHIIEHFNMNQGVISTETPGYADFAITQLDSKDLLADQYSDTLIYESVDQEWDEFRKLKSTAIINGKPYSLILVTPRLETHEIVESILESLIVVFIIMVAVFYLSTRYLSRKLWQPFYDTLQRLNNFEVGQSRQIELTTTHIAEFASLNKAIQDLTDRTQRTFLDQKQFIENASHELQTPLAITQSKLELLVEDPHLTEKQSEIIQTLIHSTHRLTKLNKTLLLLSKIENQQFPQSEDVELKPLLEEILRNFEEQQENLKLTLNLNIGTPAHLTANKVMMDLMLTNLIKNAFFHNKLEGTISIDASADHFLISNTSDGPSIPNTKLFQRFYKLSASKDSWGLGLAIVKKICDINQWTIEYSFTADRHSFAVSFLDQN